MLKCMTGGATCYVTYLFGAIISGEYQIFCKVVGLNLSNFELPYGFQSVGYQIASCVECRFKPTTTRAYLWSIKHLDIKTSFWHYAWGQKSAFSAHITWDFSAHMPEFHILSQLPSMQLCWREPCFGVYEEEKDKKKKKDLNLGDQWEKYLLEVKECRDHDRVIKKLLEFLKLKLQKVLVLDEHRGSFSMKIVKVRHWKKVTGRE